IGTMWYHLRRTRRDRRIHCPHCGESLAQWAHVAIATGNCGQCGRRVLAESEVVSAADALAVLSRRRTRPVAAASTVPPESPRPTAAAANIPLLPLDEFNAIARIQQRRELTVVAVAFVIMFASMLAAVAFMAVTGLLGPYSGDREIGQALMIGGLL